jgi:hypothetical protein
VPHMLQCMTQDLVFPVSFEGPSHPVASYETQRDVPSIDSNPDLHVSTLSSLTTHKVCEGPILTRILTEFKRTVNVFRIEWMQTIMYNISN